MGSVGSGFGAFAARRSLLSRTEPNPLDKCTVVSVYHKGFNANKITISPGIFYIPPAISDDKPSLTVIGPSSWWKTQQDEEQEPLEIFCPSSQIAKSIVYDFINATFCASGPTSNRRPGVFFCIGEFNDKSINAYVEKGTNKTYATLLAEAKAAQINFYKELIKQADISWSRTNGNPLSVSDDARLAAEKLGLKAQKAWMGDFRVLELTACKACGYQVNPAYPICPNCRNPIAGIK